MLSIQKRSGLCLKNLKICLHVQPKKTNLSQMRLAQPKELPTPGLVCLFNGNISLSLKKVRKFDYYTTLPKFVCGQIKQVYNLRLLLHLKFLL